MLARRTHSVHEKLRGHEEGSFERMECRAQICVFKTEINAMTIYKGECFCQSVRIEAVGEPEAMGYCHCRSCRSWSGGPVNAFTLWRPDAIKITAGAEHVGTFAK